jgi:hypothetical protein
MYISVVRAQLHVEERECAAAAPVGGERVVLFYVLKLEAGNKRWN